MSAKKQNRLAFEKSPYLRQHAENPVDWYPWGPEAFTRATRENKPVFLSIGYSTCHWCHVMARESFEDPLVARLMNAAFVSIKVDREERPDIDLFYMAVCQSMTGSGGWPLSIIMTPDKLPFFAATYIPREARFGRPGMVDLVPRIQEIWNTRQKEVRDSAQEITAALRKVSQPLPGSLEPGEPLLHLAFQELGRRFDPEYGGFGQAPKFPTAHNLLFLLRYWKRTGDGKALEMVEKTLQKMRSGGLYDQIGSGFHRYSTDRFWRVPHFEKMLYDQAQLVAAYLETYQATRKPDYAATARAILEYVLREMTAPGGGFYCAEDADSEGQEGKFYLWSTDELKQVLSPEELDLFLKTFDIAENGNFGQDTAQEKTVSNILYLSQTLEESAAARGMPLHELSQRIDLINSKLLARRNQRVRPLKDDKILTDWNGLMVAALAEGARVLNEPKYAAAAQSALNFILENMLDREGRLFHRYRDSESAVPAHLDDYAFLIYGLVELYETTFNIAYLKQGLLFNQVLLEHFWDDHHGGFYFTADDTEQLPVRQKEIYDGAIPSGNSVAMLNLLRLGRITGNPELEKRAAQIGRAFPAILDSPSAYTQLMVAIDFAVGPCFEVVIAGASNAADTQEMLKAMERDFIPNKVVLLVPSEAESPEIALLAPYTRQQKSLDNRATAYVCRDFSCRQPTTDIRTMLQYLASS